jgi:hypothetical protein
MPEIGFLIVAAAFMFRTIYFAFAMASTFRDGVSSGSSSGGIPIWPDDDDIAKPEGLIYRNKFHRAFIWFLVFAAMTCACFFSAQHILPH